jgi:hypothetical protein
MAFIRKNIDWILVGFYALVTLSYPTIKFITDMYYFINTYGSEKKSIMFLWRYMLLDSGMSDYLYSVMFFVLLLPIPIVILASYRFQKNINENNLIQDGFNKENNQKIFRELLYAYKRVIIYISIISLSMLLIIIIIPNSGLYLKGDNEVGDALKMNIGLLLFSLIVTNVSIIVGRFTKKYQYTLIISVLGFIIGTLLISLLFTGIRNSLGIELFNVEFVLYNLIWETRGTMFLIEFINGIITFFVTEYIIYLLYVGDKAIDE